MGWNKITIDTLTSAEDMISYELTELGATGVEVEDHVSLTEEEMKARMRELSYLKIPPREQEKNKVLLLRGERLYEETTGELREQLDEVLQLFQHRGAFRLPDLFGSVFLERGGHGVGVRRGDRPQNRV